MNENNPQTPDEPRELLIAIRRRLGKLTVAVLLLTLAVVLCAMAVYGQLANYFGGDWTFLSAVPAVAAGLGFAFGWFAGRKA
jgi:hypothetical protein